MIPSVTDMPEWVTVLEAAVLTGATETIVLDAVRSGRINSSPLSIGRSGDQVLMVRIREVQSLLEQPAPPAHSPPAVSVAPTLTPLEEHTVDALGGGSTSWLDPATIWEEPIHTAPSPAAAAPAAPAPTLLPVTASPVVAPTAPVSVPASPSPSTAPDGIWIDRPVALRAIPARIPRETARTRLRNPKTLAAAVLALGLLAAAALVARPGVLGRGGDTGTADFGPAPPSVVWSMATSHGVQLAVVGLPGTSPGLALALPSETHVILPAGDISTIGQSAGSGPRALAVAQNVLLKRVGHYLASTPASLSSLVDAIGPIEVHTEAAYTFGGHRIATGAVKMTGPSAVAYLSQASADDVTGRWEDMLAGVFGADSEPGDWASVGASDDLSKVSRLLAGAHDATVLEMPTAPALGGGVEVDRDALAAVVHQFGPSLGTLIRVVVVNGSGAPGLGTLIDGKLAPYGFSVVTSSNATRFDVKRTEIVASGDGFVAAAQQARKILGIGSVRVSNQPTSLADVTIVVGKDLTSRG
jgi:hypothetical protein